MEEDKIQAEWSRNEAILKRVDEATNMATLMQMKLIDDASKAQQYIAVLNIIWRETQAITTLGKNEETYKEIINEINELFTYCYARAPFEAKKSVKQYGMTKGASSEFQAKTNKLFGLLNTLAQRVGLGMSIKRFKDYNTTESIVRGGLK